MVKKTIVLLLFVLWTAGLGWAASSDSYNFIAPKNLKSRIDANSSISIIDICPIEQFAKGHIKGSIETNAYPMKTKEEKARLAEYLPKIKVSSDDVVIVCPRGGGGAKRAFDFYNANGVEKSRLLILEKGMDGWPYETEKK